MEVDVRMEACPRPVLEAPVAFYWPARDFEMLCEAEQAFRCTWSLESCTNNIQKREPPTEGPRFSPHSTDVVGALSTPCRQEVRRGTRNLFVRHG